MALLLFCNCESQDFSADNAFDSPFTGTNYSAGDDTISLINSAVLSSDFAKAGTYSIKKVASTAGGGTLLPTGLVPGASAAASVGAMGFSIYSAGSVTNTSGITIQRFRGTTTTNIIDVQFAGGGTTSATNLRFRIGNVTSSNIIALADDALTPDAWFGIVARWDIPGDRMRLELYNATGALVSFAEDTVTDLSAVAPSELGDQFLFGAGRASDAWAQYCDNIFVADDYSAPIESYFGIASYTDYQAVPAGDLLLPQFYQRTNTLLRM